MCVPFNRPTRRWGCVKPFYADNFSAGQEEIDVEKGEQEETGSLESVLAIARALSLDIIHRERFNQK